MKRLELKPDGFPCKLAECSPGFFLFGEMVGLKSEYRSDKGNCEAYCDSGEFFCGGIGNKADDTIVQPLKTEWIDSNE
jgi:hypothetical protein